MLYIKYYATGVYIDDNNNDNDNTQTRKITLQSKFLHDKFQQ